MEVLNLLPFLSVAEASLCKYHCMINCPQHYPIRLMGTILPNYLFPSLLYARKINRITLNHDLGFNYSLQIP